MYNGLAALSCSMNLFPMENYFTAATKRVISSMQSFTKKISKGWTIRKVMGGGGGFSVCRNFFFFAQCLCRNFVIFSVDNLCTNFIFVVFQKKKKL